MAHRQSTPDTSRRPCEVLRTTLTTDRTIGYVAPQSLAVNAGAALVAGAPSHVFRINSLGQAVHVTRDSIVGAIVRPGRPAELIPTPLPDRVLTSFRTAADGPDRWVLTFAELAAREGPGRLNTVAFWSGVYGSDGWEDVRVIDRPTPGVPHFGLSNVVVRNDTLTWAVADAGAWPEEVVVHTRADGRWSAATLQIPGAVDVAIAMTPDDIYLGVSTVDMNQIAELRILARSRAWGEVARLRDGSMFREAHIVPAADSIRAVWTPDMMWQRPQDIRTGTVAYERRGDARLLWPGAHVWTPVIGTDLVAVVDTSYTLALLSLRGQRNVLTLPVTLDADAFIRAASDSAGSYWLVSGPESALGGDAFTTMFVSIGQPCPVE